MTAIAPFDALAHDVPLKLTTAACIGLAVGLEREWSGHGTGPQARFAGLRTFFLLGLLGGVAGLLLASASAAAGVILLAAGGALTVGAYLSAVRRETTDLDATTEVSGLVVLALGALAALGDLLVAAGAAAIVVFMLGEKARLHGMVSRIAQEELEAALQFAVLAFVVLPLLPAGPFGGMLDIQPRTVWAIVLVFSALNFLGYVARHVVGPDRGYSITGLLGGLLSSTAVTLQFSRQSRTDPALERALARGVIVACTALFPRVVVFSTILNPSVGLILMRLVALPAVVGGVLAFLVPNGAGDPSATVQSEHKNPLRLTASVRMAVAFQVAVSALAVVRAMWGAMGLYVGAAVLGLTDVDALTASMAHSNSVASASAQAIAIGIVANTVLKLTLSVVLGGRSFRRIAAPALAVLALVTTLVIWVSWTRPPG